VAIRLRRGGIFSITNVLLNPKVKEFQNWQAVGEVAYEYTF